MLRRLGEDLVMAFGFLTRLPVPALKVREDRKLGEAFWAFPLAGLVVGMVAGGVLWLCLWFGLGSPVAAIIALAVLTMLTGAMHEDGLADFWDGLGGGRTRERKLEIMRDSHIGTYGVMALLLCYLALVALLSELVHRLTSGVPGQSVVGLPGDNVIAFVAIASMLARAMIVIPAMVLPIARDDGLAKLFGRPGRGALVATVLWPVVLGALILPELAIPLVLGSALGAVLVTALARRYLGGVTGDVFGASIMTSFVGGHLFSVVWLS
ncbi:MAG: adenosylcobinamide-GDP ribazoletransferase [Pseudomonadota bacterium]